VRPLPPSRFSIASGFAAVYVIWGSTYLAIRFAVEVLPPFLMVGARFLIAGLILYFWARARGAPRPVALHWRSAVIIGTLMLVLGNGFISWAEQRVPSGLAALLAAIVPFWVILLDWLRPRGLPPSRGVTLGLIIGFSGVALLIQPWSYFGGTRIDPWGAAMLLVSTSSWAAGSVYSIRAKLPPSPMLSAGMEMLCGGIVALLAGLAKGEFHSIETANITLQSLLAVAYLIFFGSLLALNFYMWLLKVCSPAWVSTYAFVNPVVAVFLGWAFAGEALTGTTLLAASIIVASVFLVTIFAARGKRPEAEVGPE
jgi:drug/metabolite transporter (DMT)-like permease